MANIIKRGNDYYVQFYGNGLLFEKFAGSDKEHAKKILKEITESLPKGAMSNVVLDQPADKFFEQFLKLTEAKYSKENFARFKSAISEFKKYFLSHQELKTLSAITPKVIESFRDELVKRYPPVDVNFSLFLLRWAFNFAIKKSYLNDNPTLHISFLPCETPPILSEEQLREKLEVALASEEAIIKYLLGDTSVLVKLKLLYWKDINDELLRHTLVKKLLQSHVPLDKICEIFKVEDIYQLKNYVSWGNLQLPA